MKFVALLAAFAALHFAAPAHADARDDIRARGILRVAVPQDSPPFGSVGKDMALRGYDIDVAALLAKDLGVKLEMTPVSSANRLPYLQTKKVDVIIYSLGRSAEREKVIDFTAPYAMIFSGVFGAPSVKVAKAEDLAGKTVGVSRGSLEDLELTKMAPASTTIKRFEDANTTIAALLSGQVEVSASTNTVVAATIARKPPFLPELKFRIKTSPAHIGVAKNESRLLQDINHFIAEKKKSGELGALYQKWFGQPLPELPSE
ncbi:MAG: transporter substrate-binding domain-containing protein [Rubrivivax sp.]